MPWNPFDWTAGPFLVLYLSSAVVVFLLGYGLRATIGPAARTTHQLSLLELAYLAGGAGRLGDAILLNLMAGNGASIAPKRHRITVTDQAPLSALIGQPTHLPVEPDMTRQQFQTAVKPLVERVEGRLQRFGYCPTEEQMTSFRLTVLPLVALLLLFGIIKVVVGAERHHPVGILIFLLIITVFAGVALARSPTRTRAGKEVLETFQASHARVSRAPRDHELLLAVALSGAVVLSGTAYEPVYAASRTMNSSGDGGGGGCSGGGGCGGCS
jgi:uncharacterized protein (TIGR04222 family)